MDAFHLTKQRVDKRSTKNKINLCLSRNDRG